MKIQIFQIKINAKQQEISLEAVNELAKSISEVGLLCPITVDQEYTLIAGLHRLEAAKRLGWTEIECNVSDLEGLMAELAKIDENLIRRKLHYTDEGQQLTRRKEIYEALHPETKNGGNRRIIVDGDGSTRTKPFRSGDVKPFSVDTAEKIGTTRRAVEQKIQVAKNLTPDTTEFVKSHHIGFKNALKLSRLPPEQQKEAATQLVSGVQSVNEQRPVQAPAAAEPKPAKKQPPKEKLLPMTPAPLEVSATPAPGTGYYPTIRDSVADLKNPDKERGPTPDSFLVSFTLFMQKFGQGVKSYEVNEFSAVFPLLTREHLAQIQQEIGSVQRALDHLFKTMERKSKT